MSLIELCRRLAETFPDAEIGSKPVGARHIVDFTYLNCGFVIHVRGEATHQLEDYMLFTSSADKRDERHASIESLLISLKKHVYEMAHESLRTKVQQEVYVMTTAEQDIRNMSAFSGPVFPDDESVLWELVTHAAVSSQEFRYAHFWTWKHVPTHLGEKLQK